MITFLIILAILYLITKWNFILTMIKITFFVYGVIFMFAIGTLIGIMQKLF